MQLPRAASRPSEVCVRRGFAQLILSAWLLACGSPREVEKATDAATAPSSIPSAIPPRAEAVAIADQLAVAGTKQLGKSGAELTFRAAVWRERLFRLEHKEADALEAVELYRSAGAMAWDRACEAAVASALLRAELKSDPVAAYKDLYTLRAARHDPACAARIDRALRGLSAFRPLPHVLAEIAREANAAQPADAAAKSRVAIDEKGPVVVPTLAADASRGPVRITSIEPYRGEDAARVVVFVTRPATFDAGFLAGVDGGAGPRLFVDIHAAEYAGSEQLMVGGLVQRVRVGSRKNATRIVLDLETDAYRRIFYLPEPFRLVIDVAKQAPRTESPERGKRPVRRVVIDPGHGGHDPGAVGPGGLREKDVTLDIAHRAAPLIARELGIVTLLTRDRDAFVPLDERAARANAFGADLFVSIHCNASPAGSGSSVMTFVLDSSRDVLAAQLAARENSASASAAAELATMMSQVVDVSSVNHSLKFGGLLQRAVLASLAPSYPEVRDGGVRRAGFYVLAGAHMPAVLFESSFISNAAGEARLNTGDYRQKLADGIVNAIRAYRDGH